MDREEIYKGHELFMDPSYYQMWAVRKQGVKNFSDTKHYKTIDEARAYADGQCDAAEGKFILPHPVAFHTVDIAIVKLKKDGHATVIPWVVDEVLLIQKPNEVKDGHWRFPGGFMDPADDSAEAAALREAYEETHMVLDEDDVHYLGSSKVDDLRYRQSPHKIITSFYMIPWVSGEAGRGFDDVAVTKWVAFDDIVNGRVDENPVHKCLFDKLRKTYDINTR